MGNAMPSGNLLLRSQWTELAQIEATKLNPPSKPWRSSLRMPKTQCSGPKNHVTLRAVFNAMRSTEVFGLSGFHSYYFPLGKLALGFFANMRPHHGRKRTPVIT